MNILIYHNYSKIHLSMFKIKEHSGRPLKIISFVVSELAQTKDFIQYFGTTEALEGLFSYYV